jgi:hypothetical protein
MTGALGAAWTLIGSRAFAEDFVVLVNSKISETHLRRAEVRDVFIGQTKQWSSGFVVQPIIGEESSSEFAWLAARIFRLSPREVITRMKQEIFRGEMRRPIVAHDAQECLTAVLRHDGGIGVIASEATKTLPAGVTILGIDD